MTSKLQEEKFLIQTLSYMKNWALYILFRNLQTQDWFRVLFRDAMNWSLLGVFYPTVVFISAVRQATDQAE